MERGGCVYIIGNKYHTTLYIGVTSDLMKRDWEHKTRIDPKSFTARYNCDKLLYYEFYSTITEAIAYEKSLKNRNRAYKESLISKKNPEWKDLGDEVDKW
jgi:putative endonuclease